MLAFLYKITSNVGGQNIEICIGYMLRRSDPCYPLLHTHTEDCPLFSCDEGVVRESCTLGIGERGVFVQGPNNSERVACLFNWL